MDWYGSVLFFSEHIQMLSTKTRHQYVSQTPICKQWNIPEECPQWCWYKGTIMVPQLIFRAVRGGVIWA